MSAKKKVAIVGFAPSWNKAPFDNEEFEIWGLNELYELFKTVPNARADRWFELHSRYSPSKNKPNHIGWLQQAPIPIYMWEHYEDIPTSIAYPKDEIMQKFETKYFTNSISWMIALAIHEGFETIHVYGVDMAQDSEYAHQRPSCEYFLGLAKGMGIEVYIPEDSDLLKTAQIYGFETDNALRVKMKARIKELDGRLKQYQTQKQQYQAGMKQCDDAINQITGAIDDCRYWLKNWTQ